MKTRDSYVIYSITNTINNKFYIGSAVYFASRKGHHLEKLRKNKHHNKHLQASFNKHGENNFEFKIIEYSDKNKLIEKEQYYLDNLNPQYNCLKIAYSSIGYKHSEEDKIKMSLARKGKQNSLGRILTKETKDKISKKATGRIKTEADLDKHRIPIVQLNLEGEFINEFKDSVLAANILNLHATNIRSCCRKEAGFRKYPITVGGYRFMYKKSFELQRIKEENK